MFLINSVHIIADRHSGKVLSISKGLLETVETKTRYLVVHIHPPQEDHARTSIS